MVTASSAMVRMLGLLSVLVIASPAGAVVSFGPPSPIGSHAALDDPSSSGLDFEYTPCVAGDGAGNWVAVWSGTAGPPLSNPTDNEVWVTRSADNGQTWTPGAALSPTSGSSDNEPWIVTDRQGVWVVAWRESGNAILVSSSIDNGATWSAPIAPLGPSTARARIATDEAGTWVVVAEAAALNQILAVRSTDDAQTWGAPVAIDAFGPTIAAIATDRNGNWVAIWQRGNLDGTVAVSRSIDNAATWQTPQAIGDLGPHGSTTFGAGATAIATNGQAKWVAIWESSIPGIGIERYSVSSDNGASWSVQADFPPSTGGDGILDGGFSTQTAADGTIHVAWYRLRGQDYEPLMAHSVDGGATWTTPAAVNLLDHTDGNAWDREVNLGYDGSNGWIATWASRNSLGGTIGEDYDILFARASEDCPTTPIVGCKTSTQSGASRVRIKDGLAGSKDRVTWVWSTGQEILPADLGDPTTTSSYVLCAYDKIGVGPRPVFEAKALAGITCGAVPCWTSEETTYRYRDMGNQHGAITSLQIAAADEGRAKIKVKAAGGAVGPPHLPLAKDPSVKVQLINLENNACWEATYTTASSNTTTSFQASSD